MSAKLIIAYIQVVKCRRNFIVVQVCTTEIFKFRASFQRNKKIASTALIVTLSICMENSDQQLSNDMYINLHTPVLTKIKYTYIMAIHSGRCMF